VEVLGVDGKEADEAACRMEHSVPKAIVERLVKYAEYVQKCPKSAITWDSGFGYYCTKGCATQECALRQQPEAVAGKSVKKKSR